MDTDVPPCTHGLDTSSVMRSYLKQLAALREERRLEAQVEVFCSKRVGLNREDLLPYPSITDSTVRGGMRVFG